MKQNSKVLTLLGWILLVTAVAILVLTFLPAVSQEINYRVNPPQKDVTVSIKEEPDSLVPLDKEFGIVIPKIGANAKVVPNVDPHNPREYQWALTRGVAHAKGTAFPGQNGNIFIFSHSSVNFLVAARYNSVFYLLNKLEPGDQIILAYQEKLYTYQVSEKRIVGAADASYLKKESQTPTLTLMTCWPPGTTFKRLVILASLSTPGVE